MKNQKLLKLVPEEILKWGLWVMKENLQKAETNGARQRIEHKIKHTMRVVEIGNMIMERETTVKWNKSLGIIICFLHDIGRFPQALKNTYSDELSKMDHAEVGVDMIKQQSFVHPKMDIILDAIYWHSRKENKSNSDYAKLIRDADKSENYDRFEDMEKWDLSDNKMKGNTIREMFLNNFLDGYLALNKDFISAAEWYLWIGSWMWDLNFEAARQMWRENAYPEMLVGRLKKLEINKEQFELIKKRFESF
jgi:HD superfamily phosphohydrolase YqeK